MRCRDVRQKLDLFVTGELTFPLYERIEAHLTSCAACQEELAHLHRLENALVAVPPPPIPDGFTERVVGLARQQQHLAAVRRESLRSASHPIWRRIRFAGGTAAALAAGLLLGLLMGRDTWRSEAVSSPAGQRQTADLFAVAGLEQLAEPGGDSLAQAYLQLTAANNR